MSAGRSYGPLYRSTKAVYILWWAPAILETVEGNDVCIESVQIEAC